MCVRNRAMVDVAVSDDAGLDRLFGRPLARMNGIGNAIVVLDLRGTDLVVTPGEARAVAALPGLGFDQLMAVHDPRDEDTAAFLSIYNSDGSLSDACGNGTRCVAAFLTEQTETDELVFSTRAGRLDCRRVAPSRFAVDMGRPNFDPREIPVVADDVSNVELKTPADPAFRRPAAVGMGNPHAVFFVSDVAAIDIARVGPPIEHDPAFPQRVNVSFAQIVDREHVRLRVWERGAGATLACGTGACATLVAAARAGLTERAAEVELPGGALDIHWRDDDHVIMTGPAEFEWSGRLVASRPVTAA